jgi:hypothetical protein
MVDGGFGGAVGAPGGVGVEGCAGGGEDNAAFGCAEGGDGCFDLYVAGQACFY